MSRPLRWHDWALRVPLGVLSLAFLLVLAVPVILWMTALNFAVERLGPFLSRRDAAGGGAEPGDVLDQDHDAGGAAG